MIERTMIFIDGDNLVGRYQSMLRSGRVPRKGVRHRPDMWVWSGASDTLLPELHNVNVIRATYYVSVAGDESLQRSVADELRAEGVWHSYHLPRLYPRVFQKAAGSLKAK